MGVSFLLRFISEVAVLVIRHRLQLLPCHLFSFFFPSGGLNSVRRKGRLAKRQNFSTVIYMSIAEINKMTVHERLTAMEQIWDSLCHEDTEPESPAWHQDILKERKKRMDSSEAKYLTVEELRNRYR